MNHRLLLPLARVSLATFLSTSAFAATAAEPTTANVAQLSYTDDQPAIRAIDKEIAAAGSDAAKLGAIAERLLQQLSTPSLTEAARQGLCQRLGILLTANSAPATDGKALQPFAAMLADERQVEFARLALQPVPGAAIDRLFLDALPRSSGRTRIAILQTIGARHLTQAVGLIAPLLADPDAATSQAAAKSLAAIGNAAAAEALERAPNATAPHLIAARLATLQRLPASEAGPRLQQLATAAQAEPHVRAAALRMLLDLDPASATARIVETLTRGDLTAKEAVLESVASSNAPQLVSALTSGLATWDASTQAAVVAALGRKGDPSAVPAVTAALRHENAGVRAAAIEALGRLPGSPASVTALAEVATSAGPEANLARQSLARINGPDLDAAFLAGAKTATGRLQAVYVEQLGARNIPNSAPLLNEFRKSSEPSLRAAAATALRETAPASEQASLLAWAQEATDATELTRVLQALIAVTQRKPGADRSAPIIAAIEKAAPDVAGRLIPVLPRLEDEASFNYAVKLALGEDPVRAPAATGALARSTEDNVVPHLLTIAEKASIEANRRTAVLATLRWLERPDQWWTARTTRTARLLLPLAKDDALRIRVLRSLHQAKDDEAISLLETSQKEPALAEASRATLERILVSRGDKGGMAAANAPSLNEWRPLFDGKSLSGWKASETPGVFTIENGAIKASGGRSHLFYMGPDEAASFRDFELRAKVMTTAGSNSGIYFHTHFAEQGWPADGYEAQVNTSQSDRRKTGSLYAVKDVMDNAPSRDNEWFDYTIKVEGSHIVISVNGNVTIDWTEPADWTPPEGMAGRKLSAGTFALQGHDPKSTTYFKDISVRRLPYTPRQSTPATK